MSARQHEPGKHAQWGERFAYARATLDSAQKPGDGVPAYMRWINRRGARVVAAVGYASGWTPNMVTAMSACWSVLGMVALLALPARPWVGLIVAPLLALGFLFDSADGQLSRLQGSSSHAGEWLDHVVDAFRSPAVHLVTAVAVLVHRPEMAWLGVIALLYALVTSGQFLSQILAEQFVRRSGRAQRRGGLLRSFILLPTDPGTLCWSYVLWGFAPAFAALYALLAAVAIAHSAISLRRRYQDVKATDGARAQDTQKVVSHA